MREEDESWLLPIVDAFGTEYLVDIEHREFRQFGDPANVVKMHSARGRQIMKACRGRQWHSFGLDKASLRTRDMVGEQCTDCVPAEA